MNIFRFLGDMSHIISFIILLQKIVQGKSAAGISLRTQEMYLVVFATRYIDLFWNFSSMYNWFLKVLFIGCSGAIVYFMRFGAPQRATYNPELDAFPVQYLLGPCALLGRARRRRRAVEDARVEEILLGERVWVGIGAEHFARGRAPRSSAS